MPLIAGSVGPIARVDKRPHLIDQPGSEHRVHARVDAPVEHIARE